jgi:hypothetical protein
MKSLLMFIATVGFAAGCYPRGDGSTHRIYVSVGTPPHTSTVATDYERLDSAAIKDIQTVLLVVDDVASEHSFVLQEKAASEEETFLRSFKRRDEVGHEVRLVVRGEGRELVIIFTERGPGQSAPSEGTEIDLLARLRKELGEQRVKRGQRH